LLQYSALQNMQIHTNKCPVKPIESFSLIKIKLFQL
jgi:hypothetical protein